MNRVFDERLELQLQEYEFAELDQLLPAQPVFCAALHAWDAAPDTVLRETRH
jgi:hypothetical protein